MTPEDLAHRMARDKKLNAENLDRYQAAMHAVQSAVAFEIQVRGDTSAGADHKHLRTGINACLVDSSAVAQLLIKKRVFTETEYYAALADAAEAEQRRMTEHLRTLTGDTRLCFE